MQIFFVLGITITLAIIADFMTIRIWRRYNQLKMQHMEDEQPFTKTGLLKIAFSETVNKWFFDRLTKEYQDNHQAKDHLKTILELAFLAFVAVIITQPYLNFDKHIVPAGREFSSAIQTHHIWTRFQECGWCAMWNGSVRGGYPAFVDIHGSALHPIVIFTTFIWGVINGSKVALFIAFWLAGVAQWWFAKELKVSGTARIWTASMAIAGGHLTSRMELGAFGVVLSTAMVSFIFPALLYVIHSKNRKSIVLLGLSLASAVLAGQGYIQVGLAFTAPAFLLLIWDDKLEPGLWKNLGQSIAIAVLLAAPFLIPFLNFSSEITKETDPQFLAAQPLSYLPLNLVIDDPKYYANDSLGKLPYPHLYAHFIGWVPVSLAVIGLTHINDKNRRYILFMLAGIGLLFLAGSAVSLKWVAYIYPDIAGVRHTSQISGLAIPLLLGLSGYGIDAFRNIRWPNIWVGSSQETSKTNRPLSLAWIILVPLLLLGFSQAKKFSTYWIYTTKIEPPIYELLNALKTPSLAWVNPPFGEHFYIQPAIEAGLKLSPGIMSWKWREREIPPAMLEANRVGPPVESAREINIVDGVPIYQRDDLIYAAIYKNDTVYPCTASGTGGKISVVCDSEEAGVLIVKENRSSGWRAWLDSTSTPFLTTTEYLEVSAPAGKHTYQFRYLPLDVPLGILLSFIGLFVCVFMWFKNPKTEQPIEPE